jgi:hypothetical protein
MDTCPLWNTNFLVLGRNVNLIYKSKHGVCLSVCGDKNKMRSWNERGPQNLRGPEPRWPESLIKDLNGDSQYPIQTSRRTWNEVSKKKTYHWGPETRSLERKPVVRVLKRGCTLLLTNTEFVFFFKLIFKIKLFLWGLDLDPIHVHSFTHQHWICFFLGIHNSRLWFVWENGCYEFWEPTW